MDKKVENIPALEEIKFLKQFGGLNMRYVEELLCRSNGGNPTGSVYPLISDNKRSIGYQPSFIESLVALNSYAEAIRDHGYCAADTDPLGLAIREVPMLEPEYHGLKSDSMDRQLASFVPFFKDRSLNTQDTFADFIAHLKRVYCGTIGYEFAHIHNSEEKQWLRQKVESNSNKFRLGLASEEKRYLLDMLTRVDIFEHFLHKAYPGQRWYSLEGADTAVVLLDQIALEAAYIGVKNLVVGMAHRGRLNILAHAFSKPYRDIIAEFEEGHFEYLASLESKGWMTDVKYHLGARRARDYDNDGVPDITMQLLPNPSHLEMVSPVVIGAVRSLQDLSNADDSVRSAMGIVIHGDAAFAGQGIVAETLNLSGLKGYSVGGSIHIIINNQLGFTTNPEDGFSGVHSSDIARGFCIPIVHVNADDVSACVAAARLAVAYREKFRKDFLINLICYRRYGHNENDEPSLTQPLMYRRISEKPTAREIFVDLLDKEGVITREEADDMAQRRLDDLFIIKKSVEGEAEEIPADTMEDLGLKLLKGSNTHFKEYGEFKVPLKTLMKVNACISTPPESFSLHPIAERVLSRRSSALEDGGRIDWAHAELLAIGAIMESGIFIRFTGQDAQRGTFSQRHAVLFDYQNGNSWTPLEGAAEGNFRIYNSPLSEAGVIGFEHGYSVMRPDALVLWEAQFGDFVNNAQSIVDEMIMSARAKWNQRTGLVMLLPHGYEGQGPNHSHAHLERFLMLATRGNARIAYPTTAAQYFHLLITASADLREEPKPLIIMTAKSLLRNPLASASKEQLTSGTFHSTRTHISEETSGNDVSRLLLCTGKIFVDLISSTAMKNVRNVAAICIEELYPFPLKPLYEQIANFPNVKEIIWLQEEPKNRGAWVYMQTWLNRLFGDKNVQYIGRPSTASPAEGSNWLHKLQQKALISLAVGLDDELSGVH